MIISRIRETTAAMAHALFHSGYSPILRESQDGTAGLTDASGRVIMVGGGLQYHSLLYTRAVASVCERYPIAEMRDGDSFISNDPYKAGNSHVPDIVVITPIFHGGRIIAFGASVAHKADVGGLVPGSSGAAAREIFHDGVLIPPVRYWTKDGVNREVEAILRNNSRVPEVVVGDLRGQVGSTRLGAERLARALRRVRRRHLASRDGEPARAHGGAGARRVRPLARRRARRGGAARPRRRRPLEARAHQGDGAQAAASGSRSISPAPTRRPRARSTRPVRPRRRSRCSP